MEISEQDQLLLVNSLLPSETGLFKQKVVYTSLHVQGSILSAGSEQGTVWLVNIATNKLIKEITEAKVCVTLVRLCQEHTFVAIGYKDGLLALINYNKPSVKKVLREKDSSPITTFLWKDNGNGFLFGCKSGKIMSSKFDKNKAQVEVSHLLDCGSEVVQMSLRGSLLAISTLERPFLLYVDTGKLTQIGSRDRKPGPYGGCFVSDDSLAVARPGLRLWTADKEGKVQSTAKFKDVLSPGKFPLISLYGGVTTTTVIDDAIQFSVLLPWINQWIVCYHGNTVLVLEPHSLTCIGGMSLGVKIVDLCTHDTDVYMLVNGHQRTVVRLSLIEPSSKAISVQLPLEEIDSMRNDDVDKDGVERKETETIDNEGVLKLDELQCLSEDKQMEQTEEQTEMNSTNLLVNDTENADNQTMTSVSTETNDSEQVINEEHDSKENDDVIVEERVEDSGEKEEENTAAKVLNAMESRIQNQVADLKVILSNPLSKLGLVRNGSPREDEGETESDKPPPTSSNDSQTITTDIKTMLSKPLGKLAQARLEQQPPKEEEKPIIEPLPSEPLSAHEIERRMQMLRVPNEEDEDSVVVASSKSKPKKKNKRKKRTHQKLTPLSSTHSSVEALDILPIDSTEPETTPTLTSNNTNELSTTTDITESPNNIVIELNTPEDGQTEPPVNVEDKHEGLSDIKNDEPNISLIDQALYEVGGVTSTHQDTDSTATNIPAGLVPSIDTTAAVSPTPIQHSTSEDILSNLDKIWNQQNIDKDWDNRDTLVLEEHPIQQDLIPEVIERSRVTRTRADARANMSTDLFRQSPTDNALFNDEEDSTDNTTPHRTLPPYMSKDDTLTRDNVYQSTFAHYQTPGDEQELSPDRERCHTYSHSVSSSYSMEDTTSSHPLFSGDSDTETEDDEEFNVRPDRGESVIASDYYSLVDQLAAKSNEDDNQGGNFGKRRRAEAFVPLIQEQSDDEDLGDSSSVPRGGADPATADVWVTLPLPSSRHAVHSVCVSAKSIWLIDTRSNVYWCHVADEGKRNCWLELKKPFGQISSSADGTIVWGVHHQQAYVRKGISDSNPAGTQWVNVSRRCGPKISRKIKSVSCDFNGVWALMTDGRILFRRGVDDHVPDGKVWLEEDSTITFMCISCCRGIVWALDMSGRAYVRENVDESHPSGTKWREVSSPNFTTICVFENGLVWGISNDDRLWFRCGASSFEPEGSGHWWEAMIGPSKTSTKSAITRSLDLRSGSFLHNVTSKLVSSAMATGDRFTVITGCAKSGVFLLNSNNTVHMCWNPVTGYHRQPVCTDPLYSISTWKQCAMFNNVPWAIREDGELFCFPSPDKSLRVECQGQVRVMAVSPSAVWALTQKDIWSRQGICDEIPQGYSWDYIELGSHMQQLKIKHLSIGNNVAWAIDNCGKVHFRFGIHPREPGTGMAPAWIEVPETSHHVDASLHSAPLTFSSVAVSSDDWLVWALDLNGVPYVRKGVTTNFPVGRSWEMVKTAEKLKSLAAAPSKIFALTENGELLRRKPITEQFPSGLHWKKLPGIFDIISAIPTGELLLIGDRGLILKQKSKIVMVDLLKEKQALEEGFEEEWDVL